MRQFTKTLGLALALVAGGAGCIGDAADIDRTQANRVDKSHFEGEWYFRPVVIDSQFNQGILFEGLNGSLDRIRWDIREKHLVAYRSYEMLEGAEKNRSFDGQEFKGTPVAAFAIDSHFDVFRDYNPATGAQSNVLLENTTDRPWWERQYMRVDWSKNLMNNWMELSGAVQALSSAPYYVQPHEIDNPHRAEITGNSINVVNNYVLVNDLYTCIGAFGDWVWCGSSNVKMKLSFMKVGDRQYEPLYYPDGIDVIDERTGTPVQTDWAGNRCDRVEDGRLPNWDQCRNVSLPMFSRFGFFRTERRAYDDEYKWTRSNRIFLANRYNIWKRSYDSQGNLIDPRFREPGKIVFYTNPDFPMDDILEASRQIEADWDDAFRETVAELKSTPSNTVDKRDLEKVFELRVNTCTVENAGKYARDHGYMDELRSYGINEVAPGNLKRACAVLEHFSEGKFSWQKPGDVRWSFMHWVDAPQVAGPLGYGPSGADPVTGEIISANSYIYGASIDSLAAYAADVVSLANGKLEVDELIDGESIRRQLLARGTADYGEFSPAKLTHLMEQVEGNLPSDPEAFSAMFQMQGNPNARLQRVQNSRLEREYGLSDDLRRAMQGPEGFQPGSPAAPDQHMSPLAWTQNDVMKMREDAFATLSKDCILLAHWADDGMAHLAEELQDLDWEEVYRWMRREIYRGVMAHEIGHTIGLRHNFAGSSDALNYHAEFWSHFDPVTREITKRDPVTGQPTIAERLMYSSIMDYDARFYADSTFGIGPYDRAAIKFGYGQLVEVFEDGIVHASAVDPREGLPSGGVTYYGDEVEGWFEWIVRTSFYTDWPNILNGNLNMNGVINYLNNGTLAGGTAPENLWKRRNVRLSELHRQVADFHSGRDPQTVYAAVPYRFCPDEMRWATNIDCQPWDKGASKMEMLQDRIERYNKYYYFTNFKRDRSAFNDHSYINSYLARMLGNFFQPMVSTFQSYLFRERYYGGKVAEDALQASFEGLNFLVSVLQQPEPGNYCLGQRSATHLDGDATVYYAWTGSQQSFEDNCADKLDVPLGVGKHYYTNWTDEYYYKATVIGSFWDKYAALWALTANEGNFYRDFGNFLDRGAFSLSYWIGGLEEELLQVFSEAFLGEPSAYSWRVLPGAGGNDFTPAPVIDMYADSPNYAALPKLESASSWTLQYYTVLLPMAQFNSFYDYTADFSWFTRTCLKGSVDCLEYDPSVGSTEFTDPRTNYTYVAPNNNPDDPAEPGATALAAKMLRRVQDFVDQEYTPVLDAYVAVANDDDVAEEDKALLYAELDVADRKLNEMVSFIDVVRELAYLLDFGW